MIIILAAIIIYHIYKSKQTGIYTNWDGSFPQKPTYFHQPTTITDLKNIIRNANNRHENVKIIGAHHSWSSISSVDSTKISHLINLDLMENNFKIHVKKEAFLNYTERDYTKFITGTVTASAGMRIYELVKELEKFNLTIPQVGSIMEQSIAGVMSTATHGSSLHVGVLASLVVSLDLLVANGTIIHMNEEHPYFKAAVVSLGALGIITQVELKIMPLFYIHMIERPINVSDLGTVITSKILHEQQYTKLWWLPHTGKVQFYTHHRLPSDSTQWTPKQVEIYHKSKILRWIDEKLVQTYLVNIFLYIASFLPNSTTPYLNNFLQKYGWGHKEHVDKSYKLLAMLGGIPKHKESEFSVPFKYWKEAFDRLHALEQQFMIDFIMEFRFVKSDDIWMSPAYGRDSLFITLCRYGSDYETFFRKCQKELLDMMSDLQKRDFSPGEDPAVHYGIRPHWGKTHYLDAKHLRTVLPHFDDFIALRQQLDPNNIFMNKYLYHTLYEYSN